jgi:hypothetical protein
MTRRIIQRARPPFCRRVIAKHRDDPKPILGSALGSGTTINVFAVPVGGIGTLAGARLPEKMRITAMQAVGIETLLVGVGNSLERDGTSTRIVLTLNLVTPYDEDLLEEGQLNQNRPDVVLSRSP